MPSTSDVPPPPFHYAFERGMFVREHPGERDSTVLWLHGLGESGLCFEAITRSPELRSRRQLVPDLPGYGRSFWPRRPFTLIGLADLLQDWLRERQEGPVHVVGHSMGGVLGLLFTERHPRAVKTFVNVDGNISRMDCLFSGQAAGQPLGAFLDTGFDALRDGVWADGAEDPALRGYYASLRLADPRSFHGHACELVDLSDRRLLAWRLRSLDVPCLYIAGAPRGVSRLSQSLLAEAGVQVERIRPAGHWPFIDQPSAFLQALAQGQG